jgi:hypothetical protein
MIDKVEFTAKNLTSNAGVLLLLNYTEEQRIFQELDENLIFDNGDQGVYIVIPQVIVPMMLLH